MKATQAERPDFDQPEHNEDEPLVSVLAEQCKACKLCGKECAFLRKHGRPKDIALKWENSQGLPNSVPFECSLCGLCSTVCPVKLSPQAMFFEMRRQVVSNGREEFRCHGPILRYERWGRSPAFSLMALPPGCDTVFFPGCTLAGTRPKVVLRLFNLLQKTSPSLGVVLDCCSKPSHDLGRIEVFESAFAPLREALLHHGVRRVLVACTSCYDMFKRHGGGLTVETVYEALLSTEGMAEPLSAKEKVTETVTVHDPCAVRFEPAIQDAVRTLLRLRGLTVEEMPHARDKTLCCGEGGSVPFVERELAGNWGELRREEAAGRRVITYCAGCDNLLGGLMPTSHVLDVYFSPHEALAGRIQAAKPPLTYWNRLRLKRILRKRLAKGVVLERPVLLEAPVRRSRLRPVMALLGVASLLSALVWLVVSG